MKIRCVECDAAIDYSLANVYCKNCNHQYINFKDRPVLIRPDNKLFDFSKYREDSLSSHGTRLKIPSVLRLSASINTERAKKLDWLVNQCAPGSNVLLIGSGNQIAQMKNLFSNSNVIAFDVDTSSDVDFFADAHDIPLESGAIDIVLCTAVLEHLIEPWTAANEIYRVMKNGGVVYSEVPFLQHVHEGAYDFTRFTLLGHELLYKKMKILESGTVAGPCTSLSWMFEFMMDLVLQWTPKFIRQLSKAFLRLILLPFRSLDFLLKNKNSSYDAASGTFVIATKVKGFETNWDLEKRYRGGRKYVRQS